MVYADIKMHGMEKFKILVFYSGPTESTGLGLAQSSFLFGSSGMFDAGRSLSVSFSYMVICW